MSDFDMPAASAGFAARGGWLVTRLAAELGLTPNQAGGIVGNLGFESGGFKELQELAPLGGAGGYGWAQWTGPRRRDFMAWCTAQGLAPASDQANFSYLLHDLRGLYAYAVSALKRTVTLDAAVFSFGQTYERPYGTTATHLPGCAERISWGEKALAGCAAAAVAKTDMAPPAPQSVPQTEKPVAATPVAAAPVAHTVRPSVAGDDSDAEAQALDQEELDGLNR